jgi:GAF domain-containing protein
VLSVISSSPGDLQPVFDSMLENAVRICGATFGNINRWDGTLLRLAASHNMPSQYVEARKRLPIRPSNPNGLYAQMLATKAVIHFDDAASEEQRTAEKGEPGYEAAVGIGGVRTALAVPMLKDDEVIGAFGLFRREVHPFTDKQIALVENFAAQAVIAIENARLLNELRQRTDDLTERTNDLTEALEQQTATSQVLQVVSSSQGDLEPVFRAMLENATRICDAKFGVLQLLEGDGFRAVALHNAPPAFADYVRRGVLHPGPNVPLSRMARTKQVVHVADITTEGAYIERDPLAVAGADLGGYRTLLAVPMLKESELIGGFVIFRQEVRPFTDKQIALVQNFAAQAVIAIENTRLLNELRASLEQQIATADVLRVISSSPGELEPVFQTMLENATRICSAGLGLLYRYDGENFALAARIGAMTTVVELMNQGPIHPHPDSVLGRIAATRKIVDVGDATKDPGYLNRVPAWVAGVEGDGTRSLLGVPMMRENTLVGALLVFRQETLFFSEKQIALVQNFARQAVIAIENARLLNELRQRTDELGRSVEEQRALGEVLKR